MKHLIFTILFLFLSVQTSFGISTALYSNQDMFEKTAEVVELIFDGTTSKPIAETNKDSFLLQVRNVDELLWIISHGNKEGIKLNQDTVVSWEELAENVRSGILIVDTCFSGNIIDENFVEHPNLIITSTHKGFYSYNPKIQEEEDVRVSLLSVAMYSYFVNNVFEFDLLEYDPGGFYPDGLQTIMEQLETVYFKIYVNRLNSEIDTALKALRRIENEQSGEFKGISTIDYEINNYFFKDIYD